jgi:hypothetical protein
MLSNTVQLRRRSSDEEYDRHWCPNSQTYAPADVLLQYLRAGWQLEDFVAVQTFYHGACRRSEVFYFRLNLGDIFLEMPVLANPIVFQIVESNRLTPIPRE